MKLADAITLFRENPEMIRALEAIGDECIRLAEQRLIKSEPQAAEAAMYRLQGARDMRNNLAQSLRLKKVVE